MKSLFGQLVLTSMLAVACGDGLVAPERRVALVAMSRDSLRLEVGDRASLRAEPRDAMGNPLLDIAVDWSSLDPAIATLAATTDAAWVTALAPGAARVVARAGAVADTVTVVVPPPITATTVAVHLDTLETLGDTLVVAVVSQSDAGPRLGYYTAVTRNQSVAVVEDRRNPLAIVAVDPGQTWIVVTERHGTADSLLVVVCQRPASVALVTSPAVGHLGRTLQVVAEARDRRGNPIADAEVSFTTTDAAVATVTSGGLVTFVGIGTGSLIATSPGGPADTGVVTTLGPPRLALGSDTIHTGAGLVGDTRSVEADGPAVDPWVYLAVTDTSVAAAPDSVRFGPETFRLVGKRAGSALLVGTARLMTPDTIPITVATARVSLVDWTFPEADPRELPLGVQAQLAIRLQDSLGTFRNAADPVAVTVVSSDTTILALPQNASPYVVRPLDQGIPLFPAIPIDTGSVSVIAAAPGFLPDTVRYQVTAQPRLLFQPGSFQTIGAGQTRGTESPSGVTTTQGFERVGTEVPVTFARRQPAVAVFPDAVTIPANSTGAALPYVGSVPGTDTIVASAPGYAPDTLVLIVTTPRFDLPDIVTGSVAAAWATIHVADSLGTVHAPDGALTVTATAADMRVALPSTTTIPDRWSFLWSLPFAAEDTGTTSVTVRDAAGIYAPKVLTLEVVLDTTLQVSAPSSDDHTPPAPRQRFAGFSFWLGGPEGWVARLTTTTPGVLRVPDLIVLGPVPTSFPVAAGDLVGTTRIVASAPGFAPDTSGPVSVARGKLSLDAPPYALVGGTGYTATVTALSDRGAAFPLDTAATFTLVTLDAGLATSPTTTVASGSATSAAEALTFTAPGPRRLAVEDRRPVPFPYAGDTVTIAVSAPRLTLDAYPYPVVGVGQRLLAVLGRPAPVTTGAVTATITSRTNRTASAGSRTIPAGALSVEYWIDGRSPGPDTLIVSAPGHLPDTVAISVTDGSVTLRDLPATLPVGDSVGVALEVRDSAGGLHQVIAATTFAIVGDARLAFSDGRVPISSVTVAAAQGVTPRFWIKALGPAGAARVRFYHLNYVDRIFGLTLTSGANAAPP